MKTIGNTIIALFLTIVLASCSSFRPLPVISSTDVIQTAMSAAKTEVAGTQIAISTTTPMSSTPTPLISLMPTETPSEIFSNSYAPPPGKLEYAKTIFRKHYALFPYVDMEEGSYSLEYYGCNKTDDFGGGIVYEVTFSIEVVNDTFTEYFKRNNWEFVEAVEGVESSVSTLTYEVYRIAKADRPAFERLRVILYNDTPFLPSGEIRTTIRSSFTHTESRKYFDRGFELSNYSCQPWFAYNSGW